MAIEASRPSRVERGHANVKVAFWPGLWEYHPEEDWELAYKAEAH